MRIAVIGSGIAGLASAWLLANNKNEEEAADRVVARLALTAALRGLYPRL